MIAGVAAYTDSQKILCGVRLASVCAMIASLIIALVMVFFAYHPFQNIPRPQIFGLYALIPVAIAGYALLEFIVATMKRKPTVDEFLVSILKQQNLGI